MRILQTLYLAQFQSKLLETPLRLLPPTPRKLVSPEDVNDTHIVPPPAVMLLPFQLGDYAHDEYNVFNTLERRCRTPHTPRSDSMRHDSSGVSRSECVCVPGGVQETYRSFWVRYIGINAPRLGVRARYIFVNFPVGDIIT